MKAYLSSYRMGDRFDELVEYLGIGAKVAVIENALDYISIEEREAYARMGFDASAFIRAHGLKAETLDLRDFFGEKEQLEEALSGVRLVWAVGGNAFLLRKAIRQSGFDEIMTRQVTQGRAVYGGWSAGAVVAGNSLRGIDLMDEPDAVVAGYGNEKVWDGLGLVDYVIVPHFQSDHPESAKADRAVAWLKENNLPFRTLGDGEVIIF